MATIEKRQYNAAEALILMSKGRRVSNNFIPQSFESVYFWMPGGPMRPDKKAIVHVTRGRNDVNETRITAGQFIQDFPGLYWTVEGADGEPRREYPPPALEIEERDEHGGRIDKAAPPTFAELLERLERVEQVAGDASEKMDMLETGGLQNLEMRLTATEKEFADYRKNMDAWGTRTGSSAHTARQRLDALEKFRESCDEWVNRIQAASSDSGRRLDALEKGLEAEKGCQHTTHSDVRALRQKLDRMSEDSGETIRRLQMLQAKVNALEARPAPLRMEESQFAEIQSAELRCQELPPLVKLPFGGWIMPERVTGINVETLTSAGAPPKYAVLIRCGDDRTLIPAQSEGEANHLADHVATLANEGRAI